MKLRFVLTVALASLSATAMAATETSPKSTETQTVQLSVPNNNLPAGNVNGGRLALLYGQTDKVTGVNVTILGLSDINEFKGAQFAFFGANRNVMICRVLSLAWLTGTTTRL